jgi:flagellar biosynthesis component FlhA
MVKKMNANQIGKIIMIVGLIMFIVIPICLSAVGFAFNIKSNILILLGRLSTYSRPYGITVTFIGAIIYDLSKRQMKKKKEESG